jgi:ABC-2 type transport system ATP-binding protein
VLGISIRKFILLCGSEKPARRRKEMKIIQTHDLTKFYGKQRGIEGVNLEVNEGEAFGFIGPNGAGKSTTIRTLLGLLHSTSGSAQMFGLDAQKSGRRIREWIGYIPSEVQYYEKMKVLDLLNYSSRFYKKDPGERLSALVREFEVDVDKRIEDLSTGNRKKVAIIQGLLHRPRLLILDEPTMGLDPLMQEKFFAVLEREQGEGTTLFFSSHVLQEVQRMCDRIGVIRDGTLVETASVQELRSRYFLDIRLEQIGGTVRDISDMEGVLSSEIRDGVVRLQFAGDINKLTRELAARKLRHLTISEPSLEEIFLNYYE